MPLDSVEGIQVAACLLFLITRIVGRGFEIKVVRCGSLAGRLRIARESSEPGAAASGPAH
jgi:hypothetical protein